MLSNSLVVACWLQLILASYLRLDARVQSGTRDFSVVYNGLDVNSSAYRTFKITILFLKKNSRENACNIKINEYKIFFYFLFQHNFNL